MLHAQRRRSAPGRGRYLSGIAQPQPPHAAICVWRHRVMQETGERDRSCIQREIPNFPFTFEHKGRSSSDSRLSGDRNRLTGGSQSISKCAREIRRTVSQFLKVHRQVSQFLNVPRSGRMPIKSGRVPIYKAARPGLQRVCSAPTHGPRLLC